MPDSEKPFTTDPKAAQDARRRLIEEDSKLRDQDAPGSHDPSGTAASDPGDDRREEGRRNAELPGLTRRTD